MIKVIQPKLILSILISFYFFLVSLELAQAQIKVDVLVQPLTLRNNYLFFIDQPQDQPNIESKLCLAKSIECLFKRAPDELTVRLSQRDEVYINMKFRPNLIDKLFSKRDANYFQKSLTSAFVYFKVGDGGIYPPFFRDDDATADVQFNSLKSGLLHFEVRGEIGTVSYNKGGKDCYVQDATPPEHCFEEVEINQPYMIDVHTPVN